MSAAATPTLEPLINYSNSIITYNLPMLTLNTGCRWWELLTPFCPPQHPPTWTSLSMPRALSSLASSLSSVPLRKETSCSSRAFSSFWASGVVRGARTSSREQGTHCLLTQRTYLNTAAATPAHKHQFTSCSFYLLTTTSWWLEQKFNQNSLIFNFLVTKGVHSTPYRGRGGVTCPVDKHQHFEPRKSNLILFPF